LIEVIGFGTIDFYSNVDVEQLFTKMYKNADYLKKKRGRCAECDRVLFCCF
jgi:hypothetical protein